MSQSLGPGTCNPFGTWSYRRGLRGLYLLQAVKFRSVLLTPSRNKHRFHLGFRISTPTQRMSPVSEVDRTASGFRAAMGVPSGPNIAMDQQGPVTKSWRDRVYRSRTKRSQMLPTIVLGPPWALKKCSWMKEEMYFSQSGFPSPYLQCKMNIPERIFLSS